MTVTWQTCEAAADSPGEAMALAHCLAEQAAFDDHDDTGGLERCRTAIMALEPYPRHASCPQLPAPFERTPT